MLREGARYGIVRRPPMQVIEQYIWLKVVRYMVTMKHWGHGRLITFKYHSNVQHDPFIRLARMPVI